MRKRTPGFVASINRKARNAVNIDIIDLLVILAINLQFSSEAFRIEIENQTGRDLGWPFKDRSQF